MNTTLKALVQRIWRRAYLDTEEECARWIEEYMQTEQLNKANVNGCFSLAGLLDYEIRSSWWAPLIWWEWGQDLAGTYFANKTKRKYKRYLYSKAMQEQVKNCR